MTIPTSPAALRIIAVLALACPASACGGGDAGTGSESAETNVPAESDGGGGEETATITIDGQAFTFEPLQCNIDSESSSVAGNGETSDGEPFRGTITITFAAIGDGQEDGLASVSVGVGNDGLTASGQPDDRPLYETSAIINAATFEQDGTELTGEGPVRDTNEVVAPQSETFPMTFQAACS